MTRETAGTRGIMAAVVAVMCVAGAAGLNGHRGRQAPASSEIYLAPLSSGGGRIRVGEHANITNHPDYEKQP